MKKAILFLRRFFKHPPMSQNEVWINHGKAQ